VLVARLDPEAHTVTGSAQIRWHNDATTPAHELWFHLYLNAFASDDSVFMRESGGQLRGVGSEGRGSITVTELQIEDGPDLLADADTDVVHGDATQMRVPLPVEVPPGGDIRLRVEFRSELPPVFARSGYAGSFHMVAQWFPKLAVHEENGTWETFPYHANGEFYAPFARYDLTVDTPEGFVVGATGEQIEQREEGGRVLHRFVADAVHDTAFCAWEHFRERRFDARGVDVRILYPPGYEASLDEHESATRAGLERFGDLFGDYPYPNLTVVVPPRGADGAAGMEYPTLFLTAGPWFPMRAAPIGGQQSVTAHELAHQWFQGTIATDEVRWPMLDEGLAEWATADLMRRLHGRRSSGMSWPARLDYFEILRFLAFRTGTPTDPPGMPAHAYGTWEYGRAVYARTAVVLDTIGRTWGPQRLERALGLYAREQRFRHPTPAQLFDAFDRTYWRGFSRAVLEPALMRGATAEAHVADLRSYESGGRWISQAQLRRTGELWLPTWVELRDAAGGSTRVAWPAGQRRLTSAHSGPEPITAVRVDPDGHNLLDPSLSDNARGVSASAPAGIVGRLLAAVQHLVAAVGP